MKKNGLIHNEKFQTLTSEDLNRINGGKVYASEITSTKIIDGKSYYEIQKYEASSIFGIRTGAWSEVGKPYLSGCVDNCNVGS